MHVYETFLFGYLHWLDWTTCKLCLTLLFFMIIFCVENRHKKLYYIVGGFSLFTRRLAVKERVAVNVLIVVVTCRRDWIILLDFKWQPSTKFWATSEL